MNTEQAREVARQYAGGYVPAITAFSVGARVSYESFVSQLDIVSAEYGFEAYEDVRALEAWAGSTTDKVWR
jgi:hypothetical protein